MNAPLNLRTRAMDAVLSDIRDGGNRVAVLREILIQRAESTHNREAGSAEQAPAANQ